LVFSFDQLFEQRFRWGEVDWCADFLYSLKVGNQRTATAWPLPVGWIEMLDNI